MNQISSIKYLLHFSISCYSPGLCTDINLHNMNLGFLCNPFNINSLLIFQIVQKLVRLLPKGQQIKREVDFILDEIFETMSPMHFHIREVIFVIYNKVKVLSAHLIWLGQLDFRLQPSRTVFCLFIFFVWTLMLTNYFHFFHKYEKYMKVKRPDYVKLWFSLM